MTRSISLAVAFVLACVAPATAGAAHKPGHGDAPAGSITIEAEPNPIVFGKSVSINGLATNAEGTGKDAVLQADPAPYSANGFKTVSSGTVSPTGAYILTDEPSSNTRYRVRQGKLASPAVTVLVRIAVTLRVGDATSARGQRVRFAGTACPAHVGSAVRIQRRRAGRWVTVARTVVRSATTKCSRYAKRVRVPRDGRYRTVVLGDADHARGISGSRAVDVG
jgi:hypothetical protein